MDVIDKLLIQQQFAYQLGGTLDKFTVKRSNPFQAIFRCDICGDSQENKSKRRGNIYQRDYDLFYGCYNCGASMHLQMYIKDFHSELYGDYLMQTKVFKPKMDRTKFIEPARPEKKKNPIDLLSKVSEDEYALRYLRGRQIPEDKLDLIYYTGQFYNFINKVKPDSYNEAALKHDHPRIVLPMIDIMDNCFGVQGRSIFPHELRYISELFEEQHKIYGMERVDHSKDILCVEGPLDSLFLPNCIAMAGTAASFLSKDIKIILDNQPRNKQVVEKYDKYITWGYQICIWPTDLKHKDINDMVLAGYTPDAITDIINSHLFSGIKARMKFNKWRRI